MILYSCYTPLKNIKFTDEEKQDSLSVDSFYDSYTTWILKLQIIYPLSTIYLIYYYTLYEFEKQEHSN